MNLANGSHLQLTSVNNMLPSEASTNNLLQYSQSIKATDIESTIHNVNNMSMMQSEIDPLNLMLPESLAHQNRTHVVYPEDLSKEEQIFLRKLKELNINPADLT
jgi:hypothetical protein